MRVTEANTHISSRAVFQTFAAVTLAVACLQGSAAMAQATPARPTDPAVTERMLHNMFIGDPVGNHDRILDFSTAVTGSLFYIPTVDFLDVPDAALMGAHGSGYG